LLGGQPKPAYRLHIVLRDTVTTGVHRPEVGLGRRIPLIGC
jgi:hypothetical protein